VVRGRTQEIGVRIALGAQSSDVARMILTQGLRPVIIGVALGLAGAFAVTRLLGSLLHGVAPVDPLVFSGVTLLVATVALGAGLMPAWQASRTDPLVALRNE
jgi:ABC-type antimicrobial peptide transport system permease subunit